MLCSIIEILLNFMLTLSCHTLSNVGSNDIISKTS